MWHSGSTAGYRAYLARYPNQHLSVAVLCNAGNANATQYAHSIAEAYLGSALGPAPSTPPRPPVSSEVASTTDLTEFAGRYFSGEAETELTVALDRGQLVMKRRPDTVLPMRRLDKDAFAVRTLGTVTFRRNAGAIAGFSVKLDRVWDMRFDLVRFPQ